MHKVFLALLGAIAGAVLSIPGMRLFGALTGAFAAFALSELTTLQGQQKKLAEEIGRLSQPPQQYRDERFASSRASAPTEPAPAPEPAVVLHSPASAARAEDAMRVAPAPAPRREPLAAPNPPPPAAPRVPVVEWIREFFTGGNSLVRVGIVILFFGVAFLLRYMAEHSHISIQVRLSGVAVFGLALLVLGWRLRTSRAGYALALQGGAVGILYLTVFGALRLYALLSAAAAFPLLALIAALAAVLAILQNSMWFALLGVTGGFLAPILASTGQGSHVVLFSYFAVLNAGILAVAWFKAWRPLNLAGFVFTFAIGTAWGVLRYRPQEFASTEPFLVLFFLFYFAITILFDRRRTASLQDYVDSTLTFGAPIAAFALQSAMLSGRLMSLAFSALAMSALYLCAAWLLKRRGDAPRLLAEAFLALGVAFLTLAIPLALDARWNAASWSLEGGALVWIGCRQSRVLARIAGSLLIVAAGCITATQFDFYSGRLVLPLSFYFGAVLQAGAAIFAARTTHFYRDRLKDFETALPAVLFWLGAWWWTASGLSEIFRFWPAQSIAFGLIFVTATTLACSAFHQITRLAAAKAAALLQFPGMLLFAGLAIERGGHPLAQVGWLAWPVAFAGLYSILYVQEGSAQSPPARLLHSGAAWFFCLLFSWELSADVDLWIAAGGSWSAAAWVVIPAALLFFLPVLVTRVGWPFTRNRNTYLFIAGVGIAVYLCLWSLITNFSQSGVASPLRYVPFLNPVDLGEVFVLLTLWRYWRFLRGVNTEGFGRLDPRILVPIITGLAFIWLNAVLLRTLHQWFQVELRTDVIFASTLVQTSLTIFWTVLALTTMLMAGRGQRRAMWLVGAALLAVVVAKLFLVDLSRIGSVERIISFVGVGLLMLVVGYFSPIPPARSSNQ